MSNKLFVFMLVLAILVSSFGLFGNGADFFGVTNKAVVLVSKVAKPVEYVTTVLLGGVIPHDQEVKVVRYHFNALEYVDVIYLRNTYSLGWVVSKEAEIYSSYREDVFDFVHYCNGKFGDFLVDFNGDLVYDCAQASITVLECTYYEYLLYDQENGGHRGGR